MKYIERSDRIFFIFVLRPGKKSLSFCCGRTLAMIVRRVNGWNFSMIDSIIKEVTAAKQQKSRDSRAE